MAKLKLPVAQGTKAAYAAIANKDENKIYILNDASTGENNLFLGTLPLGKSPGKTVKSVAFDQDLQEFTFTYTDDTTTKVDLALESLIQDLAYDSETKKLTLTLVSGATTQVDLTDLVDAYTGGTTTTAEVSVQGGIITAGITISNTPGNALSIEAGKGLFVDISTKMNTVTGATENNIAAFTPQGQVKDSGKAIVTSISDAASDSNIPTEKAVADALAIGTF
jgi:hypothetical protein